MGHYKAQQFGARAEVYLGPHIKFSQQKGKSCEL